MAFPTTSVLDDFNRADGDAGANWTGDLIGASWPKPDVASNQLRADVGNAFSSGWWNVATYGPDCEVYCTFATAPGNAVRLYARGSDFGTATYDGYEIECDNSSSYLQKVVNGTRTTIQSFGVLFASGDSVGMEVTGTSTTTIRCYRKPSGGAWGQIGTDQTDASSPLTAAGHLGIVFVNDSTARIDNFGGGTIVAAATTPKMMLMGVG